MEKGGGEDALRDGADAKERVFRGLDIWLNAGVSVTLCSISPQSYGTGI